MKVDLTGIVEDGTPRGPGVPADPRTTISTPQGSTVSLHVQVLRSCGAPVNLDGEGIGLVLSIGSRSWPYQVPPYVEKVATIMDAAHGRAEFNLGPGCLWLMHPGQYAYDIWLTYGGARYDIIPASAWMVLASVARVPRS